MSAALDDAMKMLIDLITQLPRMEELTVHPASLECFRWHICANPVMGNLQSPIVFTEAGIPRLTSRIYETLFKLSST